MSTTTTETPPDAAEKFAREPYIEIAQDAEGWHWQMWSGNGRAIARNAVAYESRKHCMQAVKLLPGIWAAVRLVVQGNGKET